MESFPDEAFRGTVSQVRLQPVTLLTATATAVGGGTTAAATSSIATVVSYTAIVDVENRDQRLRPGMTAEVVLVGPRTDDAVRIPNSALSFRPPPDVLSLIGEPEARMPNAKEQGAREVWEYDGRRFTPIGGPRGAGRRRVDGTAERRAPSRRPSGDVRGRAPETANITRLTPVSGTKALAGRTPRRGLRAAPDPRLQRVY